MTGAWTWGRDDNLVILLSSIRMSGCEQLARRVVDVLHVNGIGRRPAGKMAPYRFDPTERRVRHLRHFIFALFRWEVEIGPARHDDRFGLDAGKRLIEIAAV